MDVMVRGPIEGGKGTSSPLTGSLSGSQRVNDAHGRFFDAAYYGRLFSAGGVVVSISNATFTVATLGNTCTPIVGLYNPATSPVNLAVLRASLQAIITALQSTGLGGCNWAFSAGNNAITTGLAGFNRKSLINAGGYGKYFVGAQALTGLTNNLVVADGSALGGGSSANIALLATAAGFQTQQVPSVENIDGGIIVPPGGVIALLANTTPVAHSAVPGIWWEEINIIP